VPCLFDAIIDGAFQIQELPFAFSLLVSYHLVLIEFFFHGIPDGQKLLTMHTIQGQKYPCSYAFAI
jgi:hypothetical protein